MLNGMEIGIIYTILCKVVMNFLGLWPFDVSLTEEDSLEEQVILNSLCKKCDIPDNLPKIDKLELIQAHLQ